jgi:hypothetical protein
MEETKWLKPSGSVSRIGGSASVQVISPPPARIFSSLRIALLFRHFSFWTGMLGHQRCLTPTPRSQLGCAL